MTGLIIAGFHRSGTSSVAQMLHSYGIPLGEELMEGNEFNRFGHFECWPVVRFHDRVLSRLGANWSFLLDAPVEFTREEQQWVNEYAANRNKQGGDWALKDPRMCRFMLQWKQVVPDLKFLIVYRNPADSCQSLNRRSNLYMARSSDTDNISRRFFHDTDLALRLWVEHNRDLIDLLKAHPQDCLVLGHHHILKGYPVMPAITQHFRISPPQKPAQSTLDPNAISKKLLSLPVADRALIDEAQSIWDTLQAKDIAVKDGQPELDISTTLVHDPDGQIARGAMAEIQLKELYRQLSEWKQVAPLAKKASKRPFSLYFMNRKKYRRIIEKVLSL